MLKLEKKMFFSNWFNEKISSAIAIRVLFIIFVVLISSAQVDETKLVNPIEQNGYWTGLTLMFLKLIPLISFPLVFFNLLGVVLYTEPDSVDLNIEDVSDLNERIFIRIVTRGNYPQLVIDNVNRILRLCEQLRLKKFMIQVVTDKYFRSLPEHEKVRQILVPADYRTKTGAQFKAKALQYAIEAEAGLIGNDDWIVHLDEETVMTPSSLIGIVKFIRDGRDPIGQGAVAYGKESVVNWLTTLADSSRCSFDYGSFRLGVKMFHRPLFSFKGSFVVCKASVEHHVSFDNGPRGSIAEDAFFAVKAVNLGYTFGWVDGIVFEKSPFTIIDFVRQRRRWFQGIYLTVTEKRLKWNSAKIGMTYSLLVWALLPVLLIDSAYFMFYPLAFSWAVEFNISSELMFKCDDFSVRNRQVDKFYSRSLAEKVVYNFLFNFNVASSLLNGIRTWCLGYVYGKKLILRYSKKPTPHF